MLLIYIILSFCCYRKIMSRPHSFIKERTRLMLLAIRANQPHEHDIKCIELKNIHICINQYHTTEAKRIPFKRSTCSYYFINKYNCRVKYKNTYLEKKLPRNQLCRCNVPPNDRLVFSSISQYHATLELGMISTRNQGTNGLHTTRPYTHRQANTQLGFTYCLGNHE